MNDRWEYKTITLTEENFGEANKLGMDGWELVSTEFLGLFNNGRNYKLFFKRKL